MARRATTKGKPGKEPEKSKPVKEPAPERKRAGALDAITAAMSSLAPAREVLSHVRCVPTRMVQFDHAIRTGGWPIEIVAIGSGPSNHGKTAFALLLAGSFLDLGHFVLHIDAERTTPIDWVRQMVGGAADDAVRFKASRPDTYEDAVEQTRVFMQAVKRLRDDGHVSEDTTGIVIVDSLRKLTPKDFFRKATAKGASGEADPMSGRGPMIKAKWNTAWMDELTPLVDSTGTGFFAITREYEDQDADAFARKTGSAFKLGGGAGVVYDSSLIVRVERAGWITDAKTDEKAAPKVFGERHKITIRKTKVGGKDGKVTTCYFHTSNGELVPAGHDRARDVIDLAGRFGIVTTSGSWLRWGKRNVGQGLHRAVVNLTEDPEQLAELETEVRAFFAVAPPVEHDEDGVVIE